MRTFFALPEKQVDAYRASRRELLDMVKSLSSVDIKSGKEEIIKSAAINDIPQVLKRNNNSLYSVKNGIAFIPVEGFLCQEVDICTLWFGGTVTTYPYIRSAVAEAESDPEIRAIAFMHDSGGGMVDGVDQTAQAISEAKKTTFSFVSNLSASADYWLASQSNYLVSITQSGLFGSIGVAVSYIDRSEANKKEGIEVRTLTSTAARKKRPDLSTDEGQAVIIKELDDIHNVFVKAITDARPQLTAEKVNATEGGVMIAGDALKTKFIDDIIKESEIMSYMEKKLENPRNQRVNNTATVAEKQTEVKMGLKELLSQDPAAKQEHEAALEERYQAGVENGKKLDDKTINKVVMVLDSEVYSGDAVIRKAAVRALQGEISVDVLDYAITSADAQSEKEKSKDAKAETEEIPETKAETMEGTAVKTKVVTETLKSMRRN